MKGTMRECEWCGLGKMRQKNVSKEQVPRVKNIGERMFVYISSIKHESAGGAKFWALFMDGCSGYLVNRFLREKSDQARQGSMLIKKFNDPATGWFEIAELPNKEKSSARISQLFNTT